MRWLSVWLVTVAALAQNPERGSVREIGTIQNNGPTATLHVDSPRPLDTVATTLAKEYEWNVNAEDPPYACPEDLRDVTPPLARQHSPETHVFIPQGGALEVTYALPADPAGVLQQVVSVYNRRFPFQYRVEQQDDVYSFVPIRGRNKNCREVSVQALLDTRVSIPQTATNAESMFDLLGQALSARTGLRVSCGTGVVSNGLLQTPVVVEAQEKRARDVLLRMTKSIGYRMQWLERNDPGSSLWVINLG